MFSQILSHATKNAYRERRHARGVAARKGLPVPPYTTWGEARDLARSRLDENLKLKTAEQEDRDRREARHRLAVETAFREGQITNDFLPSPMKTRRRQAP